MEALLAAARHAYGIPQANGLAAAPGSQALFQMLPAMRPRSRVAVLAPTYEEHAVAWRRLGHVVDEVGSLEKCGDCRRGGGGQPEQSRRPYHGPRDTGGNR